MTRSCLLATLLLLTSACGSRPTPRTAPPDSVPVRTVGLQAAAENTCKLEFASPGGTCGEHGVCPDRVHRSLFWGLIEYETDVFICFCLVECEIDIPLVG